MGQLESSSARGKNWMQNFSLRGQPRVWPLDIRAPIFTCLQHQQQQQHPYGRLPIFINTEENLTFPSVSKLLNSLIAANLGDGYSYRMWVR